MLSPCIPCLASGWMWTQNQAIHTLITPQGEETSPEGAVAPELRIVGKNKPFKFTDWLCPSAQHDHTDYMQFLDVYQTTNPFQRPKIIYI